MPLLSHPSVCRYGGIAQIAHVEMCLCLQLLICLIGCCYVIVIQLDASKYDSFKWEAGERYGMTAFGAVTNKTMHSLQ